MPKKTVAKPVDENLYAHQGKRCEALPVRVCTLTGESERKREVKPSVKHMRRFFYHPSAITVLADYFPLNSLKRLFDALFGW